MLTPNTPGAPFVNQRVGRRSWINPFDNWLLCGINGSCSDLRPFAMIGGGAQGWGRFRGVKPKNASGLAGVMATLCSDRGPLANAWREGNGHLCGALAATAAPKTTASSFMPFHNITFNSTPVCVWQPFFWIVSNASLNSHTLNCTNLTCFYTSCWNVTVFPYAIVVRMPRFVPVPARLSDSLSTELSRQRRDFGVTAAVVSAITIAAAAAAAAAASLSTSVQTASTLNALSATVATGLDTQTLVNSHLKGGIMLVNQRVDLVQEQIDVIWQVAQTGCIWRGMGLCVTSIPYHNNSRAANLSRELSAHLKGEWSAGFDRLVKELQTNIAQINSTRVDLTFQRDMLSWMQTAASHLKEWAGIGAIIGFLALILFIGARYLCRLQAQRQRDNVMLAMAITALGAGQPPNVWLNQLS
ncbi:uncharacterized protein LOC117284967 [Fukomys damarensis]|uniref:uncharacterized protein LOC117284967 n=1 Tax=Fukomys damarensis TaxID=885580 RepID=UPI00145544EE|nr:uncharacterized protein LOC117284967 [Fukomys damarensis]